MRRTGAEKNNFHPVHANRRRSEREALIFRVPRQWLVGAIVGAALRGDGSSMLSFPNLIAPYAATTVAVYAWYPARYDIRDALRMGNYNLLNTVAANIAFEFIPTTVERFLHHLHLASSRMPGKTHAQ